MTEQTHFLSWVEIPISDVDRASKFYSALLNKPLETAPMGPDMTYIFLPMGALVKHANVKPSADGTTIYLNIEEDLAAPLARAEKAGGKVVIPKTAIGDMSPGYFAQFLDCEGNRVGLYSDK